MATSSSGHPRNGGDCFNSWIAKSFRTFPRTVLSSFKDSHGWVKTPTWQNDMAGPPLAAATWRILFPRSSRYACALWRNQQPTLKTLPVLPVVFPTQKNQEKPTKGYKRCIRAALHSDTMVLFFGFFLPGLSWKCACLFAVYIQEFGLQWALVTLPFMARWELLHCSTENPRSSSCKWQNRRVQLRQNRKMKCKIPRQSGKIKSKSVAGDFNLNGNTCQHWRLAKLCQPSITPSFLQHLHARVS